MFYQEKDKGLYSAKIPMSKKMGMKVLHNKGGCRYNNSLQRVTQTGFSILRGKCHAGHCWDNYQN